MARYSKKAAEKVGEAIKEMKEGKLTIGQSDKKVKIKKQAIAIGLSEAKAAGAKVPDKPKKTATKKAAPKKAAKKTAPKKASKKAAPKKAAKKAAAKKAAPKKSNKKDS